MRLRSRTVPLHVPDFVFDARANPVWRIVTIVLPQRSREPVQCSTEPEEWTPGVDLPCTDYTQSVALLARSSSRTSPNLIRHLFLKFVFRSDQLIMPAKFQFNDWKDCMFPENSDEMLKPPHLGYCQHDKITWHYKCVTLWVLCLPAIGLKITLSQINEVKTIWSHSSLPKDDTRTISTTIYCSKDLDSDFHQYWTDFLNF